MRDVAAAYFLILEKGRAGQVYNVCSGRTRKLSGILEYLVGKSKKPVRIIKEEKKLREVKTYRKLAGDNSKLRRETGWAPSPVHLR